MQNTSDSIKASEPVTKYDYLYEIYGIDNNIDKHLLKALALTESNQNPNLVNPTDPSYGLFQILCLPDSKGGCRNLFHIKGWPPSSKEDLFNPDYNVSLAAQIIAWNVETYGLKRGIAVFNSWSARFDPKEGPFRNQVYVDKVMSKWESLK